MEANLAKSITINSSYAELLPSFNDDLQSAVDAALQRYLIDEIAAKIAGLKKKEKLFWLGTCQPSAAPVGDDIQKDHDCVLIPYRWLTGAKAVADGLNPACFKA
ncbi:hypothetical protein [Candidatus Electronema sp. JC]|uniref:hypothetical protein n=1 Tax=Candidatus Electronema sp. JC TaxID=3401570 RepID=UPI003B437B63